MKLNKMKVLNLLFMYNKVVICLFQGLQVGLGWNVQLVMRTYGLDSHSTKPLCKLLHIIFPVPGVIPIPELIFVITLEHLAH